MFAVEDLMKLGFTHRQVDTIASDLGHTRSAEYPEEVYEALLKRKGKKSQPEQTMDDAAQEHAASMGIDLQDVDEGAQRRAAAMTVGRDALTLYYLATQQFTVPGLSDTVDASRNRLKEALRGEFYEPEAFLSQRAIGTSGTARSLTGKSETLLPSTDLTDAEPSPTSDSAA
jgi:hypothetical protein